MSRTRKPCPGCGGVSISRPADEVCRDCKNLLEEANEARDRIAADIADKKNEPAAMPWAYYGLPHLGFSDADKPVQVGFLKIAESLSVRAPRTFHAAQFNPLLKRGDRNCSSEKVRLFRSGDLATLRNFYSDMKSLIDLAREDGKREGRSFIIGLARGEVSVDEFNRETAGRPLRRVKAGGR